MIQDELGQDVIAIRPIMNLTLTYDHRLVDGALAGRFLRDLRKEARELGTRPVTDSSRIVAPTAGLGRATRAAARTC